MICLAERGDLYRKRRSRSDLYGRSHSDLSGLWCAAAGRAFDDGHRLIGHRVYIAGLGSAIVRGFTKGKFGASAHTVSGGDESGSPVGSDLYGRSHHSDLHGALAGSDLAGGGWQSFAWRHTQLGLCQCVLSA